VNPRTPLDRALLLSFLEGYADRGGRTDESLDSMELSWLIYQVEHRLGVELDLDDDQLGSIEDISSAVEVLEAELRSDRHG